jgi:hypothetical protein
MQRRVEKDCVVQGREGDEALLAELRSSEGLDEVPG